MFRRQPRPRAVATAARGVTWAAFLTFLGACAAEPDAAPTVAPADDAAGEGALALQVAPPSADAGVARMPADLTCYRMTVRDVDAEPVNGRHPKWTVPANADHYVRFSFQAPWRGAQYIKWIRPYLDNAPVLSRAYLFRELDPAAVPGVKLSGGANPNAEFLFGWSRPTDTLELTAPIGIAVPAGALLSLEHHYDNDTGAVAMDGSGVEICVTPTAPERQVAMTWLGADGFRGSSVTSRCTPSLRRNIQVLPVAAYTRRSGVEVAVTWVKNDGTSRIIYQQKFDEESSSTVVPRPPPVTFQPGDQLNVTCSYDREVIGGAPASLEACEVYALHSPAGALARFNVNALIHGRNTCID